MKKGWWGTLKQKTIVEIRKRLIMPIILSQATPEEKARGVAVGMAWAMTPLVGIQMGLVALTWGIAQKFNWRFSLPLALAWTWTTNVFTLVPVYYVFYVCGQLMRGNWSDITGYEAVGRLIETVFISKEPFMQQMADFFRLFIQDWGISLFLGCVPFVILGYIYGYRLTMRFEQMRLKAKEKRKQNGTIKKTRKH